MVTTRKSAYPSTRLDPVGEDAEQYSVSFEDGDSCRTSSKISSIKLRCESLENICMGLLQVIVVTKCIKYHAVLRLAYI